MKYIHKTKTLDTVYTDNKYPWKVRLCSNKESIGWKKGSFLKRAGKQYTV